MKIFKLKKNIEQKYNFTIHHSILKSIFKRNEKIKMGS